MNEQEIENLRKDTKQLLNTMEEKKKEISALAKQIYDNLGKLHDAETNRDSNLCTRTIKK